MGTHELFQKPKDMSQKQSNFGMYLTRNNLDKNSKQWDK